MAGINGGSMLVVAGVLVVFFLIPGWLLEQDRRRQQRTDQDAVDEAAGPRDATPISSSPRPGPSGVRPGAKRWRGRSHSDDRTRVRVRR